MKKIILSLLVLAAGIANAQLPVSTVPGNKQAIIEEFGGHTCQYDPDGHKVMDNLVTANPTKVFGVRIHSGSYANTSGGYTNDFKTVDGDAITAIPGQSIAGYPAGTVNRAPCTNPQTAGGMAMSRNYWSAATAAIYAQSTYVNIAGAANFDPATQQLTVNLEMYYTANGPATPNKLTVMLLQDKIMSPQSGGSTWYPAMMVGSNYTHNNALRDVLTAGATGESLSGANTAGSLITKTVTYTLPATIKNIPTVIADMRIIAFVAETDKNIMAVCGVPINQGNSMQGAWVQKANFGGSNRFQAVGFSIGSKGYVGTGKEAVGVSGTVRKDFWSWDQPTNVWTQKADFGGSARNDAVGFSIGTKGYIGTGGAGDDLSGTWTQDFWEYDPSANLWTQKANFPGGVRTRAAGFSIGSKGYLGTGWNGTYFQDMWEWDQANNTWVQKANLPGVARWDAVGFSIGSMGYLGTGYSSGELNDFWEFNPGGNNWVQKTNVPGGARTNACGFAFGGKGYLGSGFFNPTSKQDFWEFDPGNNAWIQIANYGGGVRFEAWGFAIGNRGYVGTGCDYVSGGVMKNDFWEYGNCTPPPFTTSQTNISCGGGFNGAASITPTGGITPFTYQWNTFPIQTTSSISNLSPGLYIGTLTDGVGCSATVNFNITQASAPTATVSSVNANCSSSNTGSISLNVSGGTPAYSYNWSHGATTQNASGLMPGVYSVVISDANGCSNMYIDTVGAVSPSYSLAFTANPQAGTAPFTPAFANSTPGMANYNFTWYFGDGTSAANNGPTVFHTYQFNGLYDVTLVATSIATGCSDTLTKPGFIFATGGTGCTHTVAVTPSVTQNTCQGDTVFLSCNTDPSFTYQWNSNSIAISGANSHTLAVTQSGLYGVTVTQSNCPVTSSAVQVNVSGNPPAPSISSSGSMVACIGGSVTLTATNIPGVTYLWSTGGTGQSVVVVTGGLYSVTVTNAAGCSATQTDSVASGVVSLPICMVTVDSTSTKNQVVWTKPVTTAIDSFKIYREVASTYKHVGSVAYSALSTFTDNTSGVNPKVTAYKYKITVLDTCGDESPLSPFHRTIHLSISPATPCGFNLSWNDYIGLPISQYRIMRDSAGTGWEALDSVSFGTTAWTDINCYPPQDTIAYRLEMDNPGGCVISIKDPQPMANLNLSKSNIQKNYQTATSVDTPVALPNIAILPNPSSGLFIVKSDVNITSVEVMNLLGERIYTSIVGSVKTEIDLSDRAEGIYLLKVNSLKGSSVRKIIISK